MQIYNSPCPKSAERKESIPASISDLEPSYIVCHVRSPSVDLGSLGQDELDDPVASTAMESTGSSGRLCTVDYESMSRGPAPSAPTRYEGLPSGALGEVQAGEARIGWGTKGAEVQEVQRRMQAHGADFTKYSADGRDLKDYGADGYFGPVTKRELTKLQTKWGLEPTGELDQATLTHLRAEPAQPKAKAPEGLEATPAPEKLELVPPPTLESEIRDVKALLTKNPGGHEGDNLRARQKKLDKEASPEGLRRRFDALNQKLLDVSDKLERTPEGGRGEFTRRSLLRRYEALQSELESMQRGASQTPNPTTVKASDLLRQRSAPIRL